MPAACSSTWAARPSTTSATQRFFSDLKLVAGRGDPIDVALMCIGGHYTMDRIDAVTAADYVGATTVIPATTTRSPGRDRRGGLQGGRRGDDVLEGPDPGAGRSFSPERVDRKRGAEPLVVESAVQQPLTRQRDADPAARSVHRQRVPPLVAGSWPEPNQPREAPGRSRPADYRVCKAATGPTVMSIGIPSKPLNRSVAGVLAAAFVLALAGCGGDDEEPSTASETQSETTEQPTTATETEAETTTVPPPTAEEPPETETTTSPEDEPGGAGDEEPARSLALFTGEGGRITPRLVRVPPFISIRVELRSADGGGVRADVRRRDDQGELRPGLGLDDDRRPAAEHGRGRHPDWRVQPGSDRGHRRAGSLTGWPASVSLGSPQ